jgi:hypothetical protein
VANEENLRPKPWEPGQSGNPGGSSKKQRFRMALVRQLDEQNADDDLMKTAISMAKSGDFQFWKYLYELIEGKLPEPEPPAPEVSAEAIAEKMAERMRKRKKK